MIKTTRNYNKLLKIKLQKIHKKTIITTKNLKKATKNT